MFAAPRKSERQLTAESANHKETQNTERPRPLGPRDLSPLRARRATQRLDLLHRSVSGFASGLRLKSGLRVLARVEPERRVVLKVRDTGRVRVLSDGAVLLVGAAAARSVSHHLKAWVVHGDRLTAAAATTDSYSRCVLNLPPTIYRQLSWHIRRNQKFTSGVFSFPIPFAPFFPFIFHSPYVLAKFSEVGSTHP